VFWYKGLSEKNLIKTSNTSPLLLKV